MTEFPVLVALGAGVLAGILATVGYNTIRRRGRHRRPHRYDVDEADDGDDPETSPPFLKRTAGLSY